MQQVPDEIDRLMVGIEAYLSIRRYVADIGFSIFVDNIRTEKAANEKVRYFFLFYICFEFNLSFLQLLPLCSGWFSSCWCHFLSVSVYGVWLGWKLELVCEGGRLTLLQSTSWSFLIISCPCLRSGKYCLSTKECHKRLYRMAFVRSLNDVLCILR